MLEKLGTLGIIAFLICMSGCTMCCHPYDECGPVYCSSSCKPYCSNIRSGSILENGSDNAVPTTSEEVIEENSQEYSSTTQSQPATEHEPRNLSVADQNVGIKATTPTNELNPPRY